MATGETGIQMIVLHELTSWVVWKQLAKLRELNKHLKS